MKGVLTMDTLEYRVGMHVRGQVTGIQPYGAFVSLDDQHQGLIHISECKYGFVGDINKLLQIGDVIEVVILDIDEYTQKISLSLRCLAEPQVTNLKKLDNVHQTHKHYWTNRNTVIGFMPIEQNLESWINNGLRDALKIK